MHDLVNRYRSDHRIISNQYDKLAHFKKVHVLEGKLNGGDRFLFDYSENCITLLEMGNHDIVRRYTLPRYSLDMTHTRKAPNHFFPELASNFFTDEPNTAVSVNYAEEISSEWLYYLEDEQKSILRTLGEEFLILHDLKGKDLYHRKDFSTFIVGGPGTGKTCILLNLLSDLRGFDCRIGISMSEEVINYVERTNHANINQFRVQLNLAPELDILLIDDPSRAELEQALKLKKEGRIKTIIAGFDPLQLDESISDGEFYKMRCDHQIELRKLKKCYRQKENLGKNTKYVAEIIAQSTPYAAEHKIQPFRTERKVLTTLSNDLEFVNPHGYVKTYVNTTFADIKHEVVRISNAAMWQHSPGLLILLGNCSLPPEAETLFRRLDRQNYVKTISFNETGFHHVKKIKGLEFQHAFLFFNKKLFEDLQKGFRATGKNVYEQRRLLRIPFSRAKDSLVTFAIEE